MRTNTVALKNTSDFLVYIKKYISKIGPLFAVIILSLFLAITTEQFLSYDNWMNILRQTAVNSLVAAGMLLVLLTAGIDLSVGSIVAVSSCVIGVLLKAGISNSLLLLFSGLVAGFLAGLINAWLFTKLDLPHPFISTLGTMMIYRGVALLITSAAPISGFPDGVTFMGFANVFGFPVCFIVVIIVFAIFGVFLNQTALGRNIYSVGGNIEASRLSGINVKRVLNFVYIMSGIMSAFAGIILIGRVNTAFPLAGETYSMDAIAACVIGGASFNGGKGTIWGTLIGALLIAIIRNGLNLLGAQSDAQMMVIGAVVVIAVLIDVTRIKAEQKARRLEQAKAQLLKGELRDEH
jgi:ribose transport system permease protein